MKALYTVQQAGNGSVPAGLHYRVTDPAGSHVATCESAVNGQAVADALNARLPAEEQALVGAALYAISVLRPLIWTEITVGIAHFRLTRALARMGIAPGIVVEEIPTIIAQPAAGGEL